jgi:hypothetical protein
MVSSYCMDSIKFKPYILPPFRSHFFNFPTNANFSIFLPEAACVCRVGWAPAATCAPWEWSASRRSPGWHSFCPRRVQLYRQLLAAMILLLLRLQPHRAHRQQLRNLCMPTAAICPGTKCVSKRRFSVIFIFSNILKNCFLF